MTQVISQQVKKHYEEKPVQRVRGSPGAFYVRSENPKKQQLWYGRQGKRKETGRGNR
jgi:hypothetical protein